MSMMEYSAIKRLLFKYKINFKTGKDYDNFIRELVEILNI